MKTEHIGTMLEGGDQVRKLLMEKVVSQGGMDRAALVFGMAELIVDLKPEEISADFWVDQVSALLWHFVQQKDGTAIGH